MELTGLCYICNRPAHFTCASCGSLVCQEHFKEGFCTSCLSGKKLSPVKSGTGFEIGRQKKPGFKS